ncbi:MAG: PSD1 and planctomycete cytochrome C domain-containing protein [Planctomycetota bacterium]|nr:PSD1 and planctomycete cytochrome C domain-containing protein [Planctomycetota bacterium]
MFKKPHYLECAMLLFAAAPLSAVEPVDFQRDIRPILSDACFRCHGVDAAQRAADLRLDRREGLLGRRDGPTIVVPGAPRSSELFRRITTTDSSQQMPPAASKRQLSAADKERLRQWINQGASWQEHWAFVAPTSHPLPKTKSETVVGAAKDTWARNPIDRFVLSRLHEHSLRPSTPANLATLVRRAALTLTGLPPNPADADTRRVANPMAYEQYVDRLLNSPRYGEHAALVWLDLARYADTDGYQDDQPRVMWRWRDWLINALNQGMTYDQFSTRMLAGDLLPHATDADRLATGFHRNHRTNGEGGSIPEEFRVEYVADCVETTSTVWLGLTLGCCRCHDHKYDPFTQRDYYRLFAYFNNTPEKGVYRGNGSGPLIKVPTISQQFQLDSLQRRMQKAAAGGPEIATLQAQQKGLLQQVVTTMVMAEGAPRETFILQRGQYDRAGEKVSPGVPIHLRASGPVVPENRLGLANWIFHEQNPVTARVAVNRIWTMHFGKGLVATPEDLGSQGSPPSHPKLLDWLAQHFVRSGWDVKGLHRLIVTSSTYRQAATARPKPLKVDPLTRLLWRFPRRRLKAEAIRDRALQVSGLLVERLGGPSVKPYQPQGIWNEIAGGSTSAYKDGYQPDDGSGLYRRSLYTFWRRTIPPPGMTIFDAPTRETCSARRPRTNTPLQALALLNDVTFLESARHLAESMLATAATPRQQVRLGFRAALSRDATEEELNTLTSAYRRAHQSFLADHSAAEALSTIGRSTRSPLPETATLATCLTIANTLLNLDEFVVVE